MCDLGPEFQPGCSHDDDLLSLKIDSHDSINKKHVASQMVHGNHVMFF
jgi:hypothetical protein